MAFAKAERKRRQTQRVFRVVSSCIVRNATSTRGRQAGRQVTLEPRRTGSVSQGVVVHVTLETVCLSDRFHIFQCERLRLRPRDTVRVRVLHLTLETNCRSFFRARDLVPNCLM